MRKTTLAGLALMATLAGCTTETNTTPAAMPSDASEGADRAIVTVFKPPT